MPTLEEVSAQKLVTFELSDHIATITLNRPEKRNALNFQAYDELETALRFASASEDVRCVIITGADPAFCSGDDVGEIMAAPQPKPKPLVSTVRHPVTPAALAALECEKPMIAAINGAAIGWGMELALFCDMRIASQKAKFGELFIKRGLVCDVGGFYRLPSIVGPAKAAELLLTGDIFDAAEAERIGFVSKKVEHETLMDEARALAARIACNPPLAIRYMKEGLSRFSYGDPREIGGWAIETIRKLMKTDDHKEGVAAFMEKREPNFTGK